MRSATLLLMLAWCFGTSVQAQPPETTLEQDQLPPSVQIHTLLHILSSHQANGTESAFLRTLGLDPGSDTAQELVQLALDIERELPATDAPATPEGLRQHLTARLRRAGQGMAAWALAVEERGGNPRSILRSALGSDSWNMSMSNPASGPDAAAKGASVEATSASLHSLVDALALEFERGVLEVNPQAPSYLVREVSREN